MKDWWTSKTIWGAVVALTIFLGGCGTQGLRIENYADAIAFAETGLAAAYDAIGIAKRNGHIDDERKFALIADADRAREIVRGAAASQTEDWSALQAAQAILRAIQSTLLEAQNERRSQSNSSGLGALRIGRIAGHPDEPAFVY